MTISFRSIVVWLTAALSAAASPASGAAPAPEGSTPRWSLTLYAGQPEDQGSGDAARLQARFYAPGGVAVASNGDVYVADSGNHTIRRIAAAGAVSTVAGTPGMRGATDGLGAAARFNVPSALCIGRDGRIYVADTYSSTIRRIDPSGAVTTLAGAAGDKGAADGDGPAARFNLPQGIAVDSDGNVYVADTYNDTIRMISPAGHVTTLAGQPGQKGFADGPGRAAQFDVPSSIAVDRAGRVYVADQGNSVIRSIDRDGTVRTFAGRPGRTGLVNGASAKARFHEPFGITVGAAGELYVTDTGNHALRRVTPQGEVTTLLTGAPDSASAAAMQGTGAQAGSTGAQAAGTGAQAGAQGRGATAGAALSFPGGIAAAPGAAAGGGAVLYIADGNAILRAASATFKPHAPARKANARTPKGAPAHK